MDNLFLFPFMILTLLNLKMIPIDFPFAHTDFYIIIIACQYHKYLLGEINGKSLISKWNIIIMM